MNQQEILDRVWNYFITQKNPQSMSTEADSTTPICMYRTSTGNRCAVGVLIPDENYHPGLEDLGAVDWIVTKIRERDRLQNPDPLPALEQLGEDMRALLLEHETFLTKIQTAHDTTPLEDETFEDMLRERLTRIAHRFSLKVPQ